MSSVKTADLCWGQRYIWLRYQQLPAHARQDTHLVRTFSIPDQVGMPVLRTTLNYLVRRHEALRTTVHIGSDGEPRQYVHPPGPLSVRTATTEADDTPTPAAVVEELSTTEFDLATEWPIRACVITTGGRPIRLVLVLNHLAFDAWTIDAFEREFAALGAGVLARRPAVLEPVRHQPADLARYEATPAATELRDRAVEHWRDELTRLPTDMFAPRRTDTPGACKAVLTSPAMLDAGRRIAERHQLWPSAVHLTAYTLVMGAYTGADAVSHLAFTGNRDAVPYTDVMTCMFTPAPSAVDLADDPTFSELLTRVADRFDTSRRHAYLPYDELVELLARESVRRGAEVRLGSEVNFLARPGDRTGARRTRLTWQSAPSAWAAYGADSYLRIDEMQDALVVALSAAASVLDADAVERFLRGYEAVLLAQLEPGADLRVRDAAELTGFAAPAPLPSTTDRSTVDSSTAVSAEAVRALVDAVAEVNGLDRVVPADNYTVVGGRVLRIPRVLSVLADRGWAGLSVYQVAGGRSLHELAGHLN